MKHLLQVSLRQQAIYIPDASIMEQGAIAPHTSTLITNAADLGYAFSESAFRVLNQTSPQYQLEFLKFLGEVSGTNKNWTPLVKEWNIPTGESEVDYIMTFIANFFGYENGTQLPCGHLIPEGSFPMERYNGCPYCGTPFEKGEIEVMGQGSKFKILELWTDEDIQQFYMDLLASKTALDATQADSLKLLMSYFEIPEGIKVGMKETLMLVVDELIEKGRDLEAKKLFKNPNDILRYLWYKNTDFLQIIKPKVAVNRVAANHGHLNYAYGKSAQARMASIKKLRLKYTRKECRIVATWMNGLRISAEQCCEIMHPKREMWVRFIRALRLAEYAKRKNFGKLAQILDIFYNERYTTVESHIMHYKLRYDARNTFHMLKERPGLFARSLFANMLWFGKEVTLGHFKEILDQVPARLLFTLNMYAPIYFDVNGSRSIKPLGGTQKAIPTNKYLKLFNAPQLKEMVEGVEEMCMESMRQRFEKMPTNAKTIYIHNGLFKIPVSIGDRSDNVQDLPSALMGTRFPLEGNKVRLFMQWGEGLPAQHLDMDLSCRVAYEDKTEFCSYSRLRIKGCKHSGDIIQIPDKIGTAEYIEINVDQLAKAKAKYVSFTCNAYSNGAITPNLVVGWMDSKFPMRISKKSGVAYDPSCVQHQVRIVNSLAKGMVFGVLDVEAREVVWLEMSFGGQVVQNLDTKGVETLLRKLDSKLNIGELLQIKAEAQGLRITNSKEMADEVYDMEWSRNTAVVTQLLLD